MKIQREEVKYVPKEVLKNEIKISLDNSLTYKKNNNFS